MVRSDGATTRRERLQEVAKTVQARLFERKAIGWIPLKEVVATISVQTGLVPARVLEYLRLLNDSGMFELDISEGKIKKIVLVEEEGDLKNESEVSGV